MGITIIDIVIMVLAVISYGIWLFFYIKGRQYSNLFENLDSKDFPLKDLYFIGYAVTETIGYKYNSKADRKLRKELDVLYSAKYVDYYLRVVYAQRFTFALTMLVIAFMLYGFSDEIMALLIGLMFAGLAYYYFGTLASKKILERSEEMLIDFSEVVSKLALMTNAGMILREAWEEIAKTGDTPLYEEMQRAVDEMHNGVSEIDAIYHFGTRCVIPEIKKFSSTLVQGMVKGNAELTTMLLVQSKEVWGMKKQNVRRQGEKAASKLLVPICIIFIGILIMVLVPIFTNLGM